ncbi:hypothetical protein FGO68_gene15864 [Halteria grandinella]|uniref:Uncharacterized protein n=1 Tax=Halteria grandinella TaxID=5974 RepID=A0A8J8NJ34_HALGN|nr:hypothetical protein FGO68_gene15864 [Halteria grandinella]
MQSSEDIIQEVKPGDLVIATLNQEKKAAQVGECKELIPCSQDDVKYDCISKPLHHCDKNGTCTIDGKVNYDQCGTCGGCVVSEDSPLCPICQQHLFSKSKAGSVVLKCGHRIHVTCYYKMSGNQEEPRKGGGYLWYEKKQLSLFLNMDKF